MQQAFPFVSADALVWNNEHGQEEGNRNMKERITIHFAGRADGGQEVGVHYHPETSESTRQDEMLAKETALHTLAVQAIIDRQQTGLPIPEALITIANAHTFQDLR